MLGMLSFPNDRYHGCYGIVVSRQVPRRMTAKQNDGLASASILLRFSKDWICLYKSYFFKHVLLCLGFSRYTEWKWMTEQWQLPMSTNAWLEEALDLRYALKFENKVTCA